METILLNSALLLLNSVLMIINYEKGNYKTAILSAFASGCIFISLINAI